MADLSDSHCWAPDEDQVFKVVKIRDREDDQIIVSDINPSNGLPLAEMYPVPQSETHQIFAIEELHTPPGDLIQLTDVHRAGILHALRHRFERDLIYTSVGPILVALNPFKWIPGIYDDAVKQKYADGELNLSENPHVFAMAHDSHVGLQLGKNQSLIISGESGAGKTEATKQCLSYLASVAGSSTGLQNKILQASPILEAWGNAKTLRNNNSSRFGKFIEIWFGDNYEIAGSSNTTYLLEKSRVVFQEAGERNYHIFYQLLFGASEELKKTIMLTDMASNATDVNYINQSGCIQIEGVDDREEYSEMSGAMKAMGFSDVEEITLYRAISGILHLGNLTFEVDQNDSEACQFTESGAQYHQMVSELFGLDPHFFRSALLYKAVKSGKRTSVVYSNYTPIVAAENRNALSKELYNRCFSWIVSKVNSVLNVSAGLSNGGMIGILDIFGFEIFKKNSFEQLCINLANEALQQHFNVNIFQHEMEIYESEGIVIPDLSYNDNQDVLDLIMKKPKGLIPMLDEEGQVPRGSTDGFINKFTKAQAGNVRLKYRTGQKEFTVVHYAGEVKYDPTLFLTKNKDTLSQDLVDIFATSSVELFVELFKEADAAPPPPSTPGTPMGKGKRSSTSVGGGMSSNKLTVGHRFRSQLDSLITNLNCTEPRYIRCIKPNQVKKPNVFEAYLTNEQLTYSGVFEAVVIMQNGYPFRLNHVEFVARYHMLALGCLKWKSVFESKDTKQMGHDLTRVVSEHLNDTISNCHVGKTMVFYRSEQHRYLEKQRKKIMESAIQLLQRSLRGAMVRHLVNGITISAGSCEECIEAIDTSNLKEAKDILQMYCEIFSGITGISLFAELRSLSERYYTVAELQTEAEASLRALLGQRENSDDGLLPLFDDIERQLEKAQTINFSENFNGRDIVIVWTDNEIFVEAERELEGMRIIKNVKTNLQLGIEKKDEILLKDWIRKLAEYRSIGQVTLEFCEAEEAEAVSVIEAAQKQYDDFIGSTFTAIKDGRFQYEMSETEPGYSTDVSIEFRVDAKPMHTFVEKNKKLAYTSTSMQIKQTLILCESLYNLRHLIGSASCASDVEWQKLWDMLQPWKRYFATPEEEESSMGRSNSMFRQESTARFGGGSLYRSASMVRSTSILLPAGSGRRSSVAEEANECILIPLLLDLAVEVSEEIQNMLKCCLESIYFRQLQQEVSSNRIPASICFDNVRLPLSAMDHVLKVLGGYSHVLSMNQVHRYGDAKERWLLRRGVCGRSPDVLSAALAQGGTSRLPANDPELVAAQQFFHLYTCEKEFITALEEDGAGGHAGHLNFVEIQCQRLENALSNATQLNVEDKTTKRTMVTKTSQAPLSGWKLLLKACTDINDVRKALQAGNLNAGLAQIEAVLEQEPFKSMCGSLRSVESAQAECDQNAETFMHAIKAAQVSAPSILAHVDPSLLFHESSRHDSDEEGSNGDLAPSSEGTPDIAATRLVTRELMRYRTEIRHVNQISKLKEALQIGALSGDVGELDTSKVTEVHLLAALEDSATQNCLIVTAEALNLVKCVAGIVTMRTMARKGDWEEILAYISALFSSTPHGQSASSDSSSVEAAAASLANILKKLHQYCQTEYKVFFSEVMDLQTRTKLLDAFSTGNIVVNDDTGDLNCFFTSVDKLGDAIKFADLRSEKSIECQYLYTSAKLLFCIRFQVMANRWENMSVSSQFPAGLLLNFPSENVMVELRDELLVLKRNSDSSDAFKAGVKERIINMLATSDYVVSSDQYNINSDPKNMLYDPIKVDFLLQNSLDFLKRYLGNTISSSRRKSLAASRASIDSSTKSPCPAVGTIAPNLAVVDLLIYSSYFGFHEAIADEMECVFNAFRERNCRICLVLAASIDCVRGTVDTLDSTCVEIDLLTKCIESARFYLQTRAASPLMHSFYDASFQLLNIRLAVDGCAEGVDLLTYFTSEQLDTTLKLLEDIEFPSQEITLVIDHIRDSNSIAALADAIHLGRPQFYMGRFDTKNIGFEHLLTYLEVAKKLVKRSDRLDRLMFYAELCVLLRKALINHQWDISEMGERSSEPKARGISVKQCLDDYAQAGKFFQRRMIGIPPRALVDEFEVAQREWDRRLILQGFPTALQSGQLANVPGSVELREVKYARLQQQIERAHSWIEETGVKDPDLDMLVRAGNEIVETRKALISVHMSYRRSFDPVLRSRSETIQSMNNNRNVSDGARGLEKIVKSFTFLDNAVAEAVSRVSQLLVQPYTIVAEWRDVQASVSKMEVSGRLRSTKLQVELLAAETFERSFTASVLEIFHSLESKENHVSMEAKNQVVIKSLTAVCRSHMFRGAEMAKLGNMSLRFSHSLEMLYGSAVVLMNLYVAESSRNYEELDRDWKSANFLAQLGTATTPGVHLLEQSFFSRTDYTVQAILRTTIVMKTLLHPCVAKQVSRACRHVEDEITLLELSMALKAGAVCGRVGGIATENISIASLETALHRAHETSNTDVSNPSLLLDLVDVSSLGGVGTPDVSWRAPCRLKYSSKYSITEVALIDLSIGWGSGLASQMYTEKWGTAKRQALFLTAAKVKSPIAKAGKPSKWGLLKAHLKAGNIVPQFKYLDESFIKEALASPALASMSLIDVRRPDVIQLRNSCEMICELRRSMKVKDYETAFEILNENLGKPGYSFTDMFRVIYEAEFSIHPLAMEEFTLIALEVCESYWRVLAREALSQGVATGTRGRINIVGIQWNKLDEVLALLDGLLEISRESIILRELCYMVRYMRRSSIRGGEGDLRGLCRDGSIKGKADPNNKRGPLLDLTADDVGGAEFIEDAAFNAVTMTNAIAMKTDRPEEPKIVKEAQIAFTGAERVLECLGVIDDNNIHSLLRSTLHDEATLLRAHNRFILGGYALEKAYSMEGMWFSFTSSTLEVSDEVCRILTGAVEEAHQLKLDAAVTVEARWSLMLAAAVDLLEVMAGCTVAVEDKESVFGKKKPVDQKSVQLKALESLRRVVNYYEYCDLLSAPPVLCKYKSALENALSEHDKVTSLLAVIAGTREPRIEDGFDINISDLADSQNKGDTVDLDAVARLDHVEMASFRGSVIWRIALLHVKLRQALKAEQWSLVSALAEAIVAADMFNVRSRDVSSALLMCRCLKIQRNLEIGISECILPPFPGWSSFSNYRTIICKISDFSLRQAIEDCERYMEERNYGQAGSEKLGQSVVFNDFPLIPELFSLAVALVDLVSALRGSRWTSYDRGGTAVSQRRSSLGSSNIASRLVVRASKSLYLQDGNILIGDSEPDSDSNVSTVDQEPSVSLEEITQNLDNENVGEVNTFRAHRSVEDALTALCNVLRSSTLIDNSCGVGNFLEYTITTVSTELQFIGLDDKVKLAIEECVVSGVPGNITVAPESISLLKSFCDSLTYNTANANDGELPVAKASLMLKCSRLRRGYLSGKLLLEALMLISKSGDQFSDSSLVDDQNFTRLYQLLQLYRRMASLEWTDPEAECDRLMTSPNMHGGSQCPAKRDDALSTSNAEFAKSIDQLTEMLNEASMTVTGDILQSTSNIVDLNRSSSSDYGFPGTDLFSLEDVSIGCCGCELKDLLRATEEIAPFMQLLDQHCAFKIAEAIFRKELDDHMAYGSPGELDTSKVDPKPLQVVMQILLDSGLIVDGMPGQYLYGAAKALSGLRISQTNVGPLTGDPASNDRSMDFSATLHSALSYADELSIAEEEHNIRCESTGEGKLRYLLSASKEIETARQDILQRDFARRAFDAITTNRISLDGEENNLSLGDEVVSKIIAPVDVSKLALSIAECSKFGVSNLCSVVSELYAAACKLNEIRVTCMTRSWTDIVDIFEREPHLAIGDKGKENIPNWQLSFHQEIISSQRLAVVSLAVEACDYALMVGRIPATPLGTVEPFRLNCTVVSRALDALSKVPNDWRYETIRSYIFTLEAIQMVRRHAAESDWNTVHDVCRMSLHEDRIALKPLNVAGLDEIQAALAQSSYYLSEFYLLTALSSQWRMRGSVGSADGSCISAVVLKEAVQRVDELGTTDNEYIQSLQTSARIIFDLRRAQLYGLWVAPANSLADFNVSIIEESLLSMCIPSAPVENDSDLIDTSECEISDISKGFLKVSDGSVFGLIDEGCSTAASIPDVPALIRWLMRHSDIDLDFTPLSEDEEILSVEEVLQGAEYIDNVIGLAEQTQEELDFAREELCYRIVAVTLLRALSTPGCHGCPGNLHVDSPDVPSEEGAPSIAHAIEIAERNIELCSQSHCKWLLRDAKLLYRLRTSRRGKDWGGVREVLLEALDQNDVEALNEFHAPRVSMISDGVRERSNNLVHQPILAPVWTEIMIIRADFNFYACLADFAQEISNGARRPDGDTDPKDKRPLTAILHILLRTRAASLMWPDSDEFNRLIETEEAALELRAQRIFDSGHFPSTNVINTVEKIRARDRAKGLISYGDLLMPEIDLLSDMLNIQQLVDSMENALNVGQGYLRCPIGHISRQEMELDLLGDAVKACLLQKLDATGSAEQIKLVKLGNVMYAIRTSAAEGKWGRVDELIQGNLHVLRGRVSITEELARLNIEALNFEACSILRKALSSDRFTNVLELVKRISKHKMMGQHTSFDGLLVGSVSHSSFESDVALATKSASVSGSFINNANLRKDSSSEELRKGSVRSSIGRRTSYHDNSWKSFSEELVPHDSIDGFASNRVDKLENAINLAMTVHHKSDVTSSLLKAAVLIRSLRTAISAGYWDEVQQIVSEESNYRNTKVPTETLEEIRVAKAALHYRNCMIALSKGLIVGRATGSPGNMNLSSIECIMLQSAISQAEVLEIDADPGALAMLDIARCVCALRQAIMAARWFTKSLQPVVPSSPAQATNNGTPRAMLGSPAKFGTSFDFSTVDDAVESSPEKVATNESHRRSESGLSVFSDDGMLEMNTANGVTNAALGIRKNASVEEVIIILKSKLSTLPDEWEDDANSDGVSRGRKESLADVAPDETLASDNSLDWIALQARAVRSSKHEVNLLDENLKERRRQEYIVGALESIPAAVQIFRTGGGASGRAPQGARGLDGMIYPNAAGTPTGESRGTPTCSKDLYLAKPLELALAAARDIPGVISDDTAKLIRTAELILSFRQAMNDLEIDNFKKLIESARVLTEKGLISGHYGVFELSTYRSATMTVSLSKAELMKAIRSGTVRGHINAPFYESIEVDPLHYWVEAHEASAKDMTIALKHALIEAKILTELRRRCKARDWSAVKKIVEEEYEDIKNVQYAKDEIEFIILACRYQLDIGGLVEEVTTNQFPKSVEEQFSYVSVRMSDMRRGGRTADSVLLYITEKNLVDSKVLKKLALKNSPNIKSDSRRDMSEGQSDNDTPDLGSDANNKSLEEGHYHLAVECYAIKRLLKLWNSIESRQWQMEPIAAGMVHAFSIPEDPFLSTFMNSLRQHEVVQRLASVHSQLQSLKIKDNKRVKNIKHTVRASVAFVLRTRISVLDNIAGKVDPVPPSPAVLRTLKQRSQHFFVSPVQKEIPKKVSVANDKRVTGANGAVISSRKASLCGHKTDSSPVPPADPPNAASASEITPKPGFRDEGASSVTDKPAPLLRAKATRRMSLGAVAQDMNLVPTEQLVMDNLNNPDLSVDISKANRRMSIGSVAEQFRGKNASAKPSSETDVQSVANILCSEDWTSDPEFVCVQFDTARNTLIDQVVQMRLMWGCMEGSVEEDADGNVLTDSINTDLLTVALSDVRKVEFYTHKGKTDFKFSKHTLSIIHCATGILHCRDAAASEKYDDLMCELRRLKYVVDQHSSKRMDLPDLCPTTASEAEFDRFVRLACQQHSLFKFCDSINLLWTRSSVDMMLLRHPVVTPLGEREIMGISPASHVTPIHALVLLLGMSIKSALIAAHNGNTTRVRYEQDICVSLLTDPQWDNGYPVGVNFEALVSVFNMLGGYPLVLSSTGDQDKKTDKTVQSKIPFRAPPKAPTPVKPDGTIFSFRSSDEALPESETKIDLEKMNKILLAFLLTADKVAYDKPLLVLSDLVEELKYIVRRLEATLATVESGMLVDPWIVLTSNLLLLCARPAYTTDEAGRYLHKMPYAVCGFLRDCCGSGRGSRVSDIKAGAYVNYGQAPTPIPTLEHFVVTVDVSSVTSFIRTLVLNEAYNMKDTWNPISKNSTPAFRTAKVTEETQSASCFIFAGEGGKSTELTSVDETERCIRKVRSLYLSSARSVANATQIGENNSTGLAKVAMLDATSKNERSKGTHTKNAVKERLYSRFGRQCEILLRNVDDIHATVSGGKDVIRSKNLRSAIYKRRKQLKN